MNDYTVTYTMQDDENLVPFRVTFDVHAENPVEAESKGWELVVGSFDLTEYSVGIEAELPSTIVTPVDRVQS